MNDLNLNPFLFPNNSPYVDSQKLTSGYAFDYENESGIISTSKIRQASIGSAQIQDAAIGNAQLGTAIIGTAQIGTLTFSEISGGTATLGGTTNGNGVWSVKNASGSEVVRADNTGLTVSNGSIAIQDSSGTNIIDATGLVSSANFAFGGTSSLDSWYGTSATYVPITNATVTFNLSRSANVLFMTTVQARIINPSQINQFDSADIMPRVNGTNLGGTTAPSMNLLADAYYSYFGIYSTHVFTMSRQSIMTVGAGTSTFTLVAQTSAAGASGTLQVIGFDMNYVVLGK